MPTLTFDVPWDALCSYVNLCYCVGGTGQTHGKP